MSVYGEYERNVIAANNELTKKHGDPYGPKSGECCACRKPMGAYASKFLCITHPLMRCPDHGDWPAIGWVYYTDG